MAGPYDYTINIPQPPAQNFLQSLLGIQQLRQMQEQSALQQQQAAFAAQMQPLQLAAERERINQLKASTGATETSQQAAAYQLQQRKDLDAELLGMSSDPAKFTADNLQKLAVRFHSVDPTLLVRAGEMRKNLPDQAKIFGDNVAKNLVITSVTGDSEEAIKQLDKQLEAAKNTPELQDFVPKLEQLKDNFIKYPDQTVALAAVGQTLFAPDQGKAITDVLAKQADIGKTKAETKKEEALTKKALGEIPSQERPLPSSILRDNSAIEKKVTAANEMADKLSQAAEAMRALPSVGSVKEWWTNVKPKLGFGENPEIAVRSNAAQLAGLGMLGAESSAMGGAIRSNVQFQYATSKLPDAWSAPQELAKRLEAQAEVQRKLAQIMTIDAEWNSAFRGSQKATKDEQILGMDVAPGMTKAQFKEAAARQLFPPSQPSKPTVPPAANPIEDELRRRGLLK